MREANSSVPIHFAVSGANPVGDLDETLRCDMTVFFIRFSAWDAASHAFFQDMQTTGSWVEEFKK